MTEDHMFQKNVCFLAQKDFVIKELVLFSQIIARSSGYLCFSFVQSC